MLKKESLHIIKAFPEDTITGGKNFVICMLEDSKHNLWIGNYGGGGCIYSTGKQGSLNNYLTSHNVISIREDRDGKIWAGSEEGLYDYNRATTVFAYLLILPRG